MIRESTTEAGGGRRQARRAATQAAILEAARAIMRVEGAGALTLSEVARRMGMRTPSLYEYYPNKLALYDALFRLGFELFGQRMEATLAQATPLAALRTNLETYLAFAQENPDLFQLCFERPVPGFVPSAASLAVSQAVLARGVERVARFMTTGQLRPPLDLTPLQMLDLMNALTHGLTALHQANEPHLPAGQGRFGSLIPAAVELFRAASEQQA